MTNQEQIDYTEIRDEKLRSKICELMSEMLDNPDRYGIYPTSRFMWKMETYILDLMKSLEDEKKLLEKTVKWCNENTYYEGVLLKDAVKDQVEAEEEAKEYIDLILHVEHICVRCGEKGFKKDMILESQATIGVSGLSDHKWYHKKCYEEK